MAAALALAGPARSEAVVSPQGETRQDRRVMIVFHPGGSIGDRTTVYARLSHRPLLSLGLLGATQGSYSVRQTLLDFTQGHRISKSGYDPRELPRLRLEASGDRGRMRGWRGARRRARSAPAELDPGLLASRIPGGAAYVGVGRVGNRHTEATVAADRRGRVDEVSLGLETDIAERAQRALRGHRLVVVALPRGKRADRALDQLIAKRRAGQLLLVVRTPPRSRATQLLPTGAAGLGDRPPGLLRSRTTRRDGLVAGHDVLPTVLTHLGITVPEKVRGRPMFVTGERDAAALRRLERRLRVVFPRRFPSLLWVFGALALVLAGGAAARRWSWALRTAGLMLMWVPAMALVTAALAPARVTEKLIMSAGCVLAALLTDRLVRWPRAPVVPALGGVIAYVVDLFFGSALIVRSLLGPNPRFGARWFGIGNELEAILPGLLLVGIAAAAGTAGRSRRLAAAFAIAMGALTVVVAAGRLGADVGGVFTIGAGGAAAALVALPGRVSWRRVAIACAVPAAGLVGLALIDVVTGGDSHFAATILGAEDSGALFDVVKRRTTLAVNALLRGFMPLATVLAVAALVYGWRHRERLFAPVHDRPAWAAALVGGAAGGVVGTLTNDSGPVLLVIAMVVLIATTAYLRGGTGAESGAGTRSSPPR